MLTLTHSLTHSYPLTLSLSPSRCLLAPKKVVQLVRLTDRWGGGSEEGEATATTSGVIVEPCDSSRRRGVLEKESL
jgi:hypothetical protein